MLLTSFRQKNNAKNDARGGSRQTSRKASIQEYHKKVVYLETSNSISSYVTLTEEAEVAVQGFMSIIQEKYGNDTQMHFPGGSVLDYQHFQMNRIEFESESQKLLNFLKIWMTKQSIIFSLQSM